MSYARQSHGAHAHAVVLVPAQELRDLMHARLAPEMAHDEQSLSAIAASSAVASRARVHELLGRRDVQVSCLCPCVRLCMPVTPCAFTFFMHALAPPCSCRRRV